MALLIPPGFIHAVYILSLQGDEEDMVVTCGHEIDGGSGASPAQSADDLFAAFAVNVMPGLPNVYQLVGVDAYVGQDGGPPVVVTSNEEPVPGSGTSEPVPQNTAFLVRKRTDLAGRRGRGRLYLPGVPEGQVGPTGMLTPAVLADQQVRLDAWMAALTTAGGARFYPPVVLHRSEGIGEEPPPTPVVRFLLEPQVATQRRRLRA